MSSACMRSKLHNKRRGSYSTMRPFGKRRGLELDGSMTDFDHILTGFSFLLRKHRVRAKLRNTFVIVFGLVALFAFLLGTLWSRRTVINVGNEALGDESERLRDLSGFQDARDMHHAVQMHGTGHESARESDDGRSSSLQARDRPRTPGGHSDYENHNHHSHRSHSTRRGHKTLRRHDRDHRAHVYRHRFDEPTLDEDAKIPASLQHVSGFAVDLQSLGEHGGSNHRAHHSIEHQDASWPTGVTKDSAHIQGAGYNKPSQAHHHHHHHHHRHAYRHASLNQEVRRSRMHHMHHHSSGNQGHPKVSRSRCQTKGPRSSAKNAFVYTQDVPKDSRYRELFYGEDKDLPTASFMWSGKNLCYDPRSKAFVSSQRKAITPKNLADKFLLATPDKRFVHRNIAEHEVACWVEGTTVIARNYSIAGSLSDVYDNLLPVVHIIRHSMQRFRFEHINVALDGIDASAAGREAQNEFIEVALKSVPTVNRYDPQTMSGVTCFERAVLIDRRSQPAVQYTAFKPDIEFLRHRIEIGRSLNLRLVHDCSRARERKTVWIVQRRDGTRQIENLAELTTLVHSVFGNTWDVRVFDSPNVACRAGVRGAKSCFGLSSCNDQSKGALRQCKPQPALLDDVDQFNQVAFMIGIHGGAFSNLIWMPSGAHVVELFPQGVEDYRHEEKSLRAGLHHFTYRDPDMKVYNDLVGSEFLPSECTKSPRCRKTMLSQHMRVSVEKLRPILEQAHESYVARCLAGAASSYRDFSHRPM